MSDYILICKKCKQPKTLDCFYGKRKICKDCFLNKILLI